MTEGETQGLLAGISDRLIKVLPPAFLLLVIMNIAFLGATMYLVQHNADARNAMLQKIIENCLQKGNP